MGEFEMDLLCMCQTFDTPKSLWKNEISTRRCKTSGFTKRWRLLQYASAPDEGVFSADDELVSGGLHALAFREAGGEKRIVVAFRHQEGESVWDSDQLEAMGLWGRDATELFVGKVFPTLQKHFQHGSVLSRVCHGLQMLIHGIRRYLRLDYFSRSEMIVEFIRKRHPSAVMQFTGYSMGGAIAQLRALRMNTAATTFASNGIADVFHCLYKEDAKRFNSELLTNIFHSGDIIPSMDCQFGRVCPRQQSSNFIHTSHEIHSHFLYGNSTAMDWISQCNGSTCLPAHLWNLANAVCRQNQEKTGLEFVIFTIFVVIVFLTKKRIKYKQS